MTRACIRQAILAAALLLTASAALAQYAIEGLGTFEGMGSRAVGINDAGLITGTRTGT